MKKLLLIVVLATSVCLSTFASNKIENSTVTASDSLMLKEFESQIREFDAADDRIKITNLTSKISKNEQAECSVTFSMEAEASFFGTGVKFGVSVTFTAADCGEAGRKAREGVMSQISNFKAVLAQAEQQLSAFLDWLF